ncbi:neuropeptide-like 3 [Drosophila guanche]|uniref:Blast:Neuropeptide-like 3 n=1 Tax=Drosophila guanche TaxID=7266 RepID=A0A3B0K151_DROGU|nr:neuropeptide-like 3 [Drosophila guanche]SPP87053.1 blast:Neuropeptide-like 3 [Drosophila guanche]
MFKLCVFVALLSLAAAAPAPAPAPVPAPAPAPGPSPSGLLAPAIWGPGVWGPTIVGGPHVVSVVPQAISHAAITQVHPSPLLLKSVHGPVLIG